RGPAVRQRDAGPVGMRGHGVPEDHLPLGLQLGQHPVDDRPGRLAPHAHGAAGPVGVTPAGQVALGGEGDAGPAHALVAGRLTHEIAEGHPDLSALALVGIYTRGVTIAHRLRALIEQFEGVAPATGALDITFYRDDMTVRAGEQRAHPQPVVKATRLDFPLDGKSVVIVDDVLYTGRTIRSAIEALFDYGRPQRVQLAVLVDRGHRELPIRPDHV